MDFNEQNKEDRAERRRQAEKEKRRLLRNLDWKEDARNEYYVPVQGGNATHHAAVPIFIGKLDIMENGSIRVRTDDFMNLPYYTELIIPKEFIVRSLEVIEKKDPSENEKDISE